MAHLTKAEVVAKIKDVLSAHGVWAQITTTALFPNELCVELGYKNIENDPLINDLNRILWNDTAPVSISPCREVITQQQKQYH